MAEISPGKVSDGEGATASGHDPMVSQEQSLASMLLDEAILTVRPGTTRTRLSLWVKQAAVHGRVGTGSFPESPEVSKRALSVVMQEAGSLKGPPLVSGSRNGKGNFALPSKEASPQQAEAPGTADQGLSTSNEPDRSAPAGASETESSPSALAAATGGALECGKGHESSEGAAKASGGRAGTSQAASRKPFTPQQHAVVAALRVVMKLAKDEGHVASITARARLICNNKYTLVVVQYIGDGEGLPSMDQFEQMVQRDDRDQLDLLRMQCTVAGFHPLHVFNRSAQCGAMTACISAHSRGNAAVLARHQQVAELDRQLKEQSFPLAWRKATINLLAWRGVPERMAELIMFLPLLLAGLCKRCFRPSDTGQGATPDYASVDHLFPGSCYFYTIEYRHAALIAGITSAMTQSVLRSNSVDEYGSYLTATDRSCHQQSTLCVWADVLLP